jgi:hypothetical protein
MGWWVGEWMDGSVRECVCMYTFRKSRLKTQKIKKQIKKQTYCKTNVFLDFPRL